MMLKRQATETKSTRLLSWLRATGAVLGVAGMTTSVVSGCLDRKVAPQEPHTSNVFVAEIRQTAVDKIDLLMMIDNSISMADKQSILGDAVGSLVQRLVAPLCVDGNGNPNGDVTGNDGRCGKGSPEFSPIKDIHVGIVSSSLGSHGGGGACVDDKGDDMGQFVATARPRDPAYPFTAWPNNDDKSGGFLAWDPDTTRPRNNPPGITQQMDFATNFRNMVLNVGQSGCGFESTLEGWYRFLIDPEPLTARTPVVTDPGGNVTPTFNDQIQTNTVLQQRARFLRQDSLLAVIMLSDENDCSIIEAGQGWLVGTSTLGGNSFRMPRATSACEMNPNSPCCVSCAAGAPANCPAPAQDPACAAGAWTATDDNLNLRCYNQKRRFGFDLLYPTQRYVDGLWETTVRKRDGVTLVPNPIYASSPPRDRSLVFLAGIVGVPWQDIAKDPNAANLQYMTYAEMVAGGRWEMILGTPGDAMTAPTPPTDKLMFETPKDRTTLFGMAAHPVIGAGGALAPATTMGSRPNVINGHESNIADNSDLQYACIFPLPMERPACSGAGCDCVATDGMGNPVPNSYNRPLCNGTTQTHAKAFPGVRELQVLKDYGAKGTNNAIVASICPKSLSGGATNPGYGYNPAVSAIVDRLKEALRGKCLPRKLVPDMNDQNRVPCAVVESSVPPAGQACSCTGADRRGRKDVASDDLRAAVYRQLHESGYCGGNALPACEAFCLCEIEQITGGDLGRCTSETTTPTDIFGYCYVDPSTAANDAAKMAQDTIVASCPDSQKRLLRFTGENVPAKGSIAMIACLGATITGSSM